MMMLMHAKNTGAAWGCVGVDTEAYGDITDVIIADLNQDDYPEIIVGTENVSTASKAAAVQIYINDQTPFVGVPWPRVTAYN